MIDFHSHFFSRPFFDALASQSPLPGSTDEKLAGAAARAKIDVPAPDLDAHLARWIREWDAAGVEHAVSFASAPEEVPALAEASSQARGRLTPFALVNPTAPGAAERAASLLAGGAFKGILLFPAMHRFDPAGEQAAPVLAAAEQHGAIVVVHCGLLQVKLRDLLGLPRPYDFRFADPLNLVPAANRFRGATFVVPHFGAGLLRETLMLGSQCENVCVDTSSSNAWLATQEANLTLADVFARALGVFGPERVLFGTDSSTFPRGFRKDLAETQRAALAEAGADEATVAKVFGGNARRLLRLAGGA